MTSSSQLSSSYASGSESQLSLINGMMQRFAQSGDALAGLNWALPLVLEELQAEAGSLWLHRPDEKLLECVVCIGPVDITGLKVPEDKGLVGRAFCEGEAEIVADTSQDKGHDKTADKSSGFVTLSTATAPVHLGDKHFGAIQAINRRLPSGDVGVFSQQDMPLLEGLAGALAMALSNVELAQEAVAGQLLARDVAQATEAQSALLPTPDSGGFAAGEVIPARHLSGDFFDYMHTDDKLFFCQGDVAGKGIVASLLMARSVALFRRLVRDGFDCQHIALEINRELLLEQNDRFVTFAVGEMDVKSGQTQMVNCGHGPVILTTNGDAVSTDEDKVFDAQCQPLGIAPIASDDIIPFKFSLKGAYLALTTDGITEATTQKGEEIGLGTLQSLMKRLPGKLAFEKCDALMGLFNSGKLKTHDDATILVITCPVANEGDGK